MIPQYSFTQALEILTFVAVAVVIAVWIYCIFRKNKDDGKENTGMPPESMTMDSWGLTPPPNAYCYYPCRGLKTYITQGKKEFHVYAEVLPAGGLEINSDRYGRYFIVKADTCDAAERIIDAVFNIRS